MYGQEIARSHRQGSSKMNWGCAYRRAFDEVVDVMEGHGHLLEGQHHACLDVWIPEAIAFQLLLACRVHCTTMGSMDLQAQQAS